MKGIWVGMFHLLIRWTVTTTAPVLKLPFNLNFVRNAFWDPMFNRQENTVREKAVVLVCKSYHVQV